MKIDSILWRRGGSISLILTQMLLWLLFVCLTGGLETVFISLLYRFRQFTIFILFCLFYLKFIFHTHGKGGVITNRLVCKEKKKIFHLQQCLKQLFEINREYVTTLIKWITGLNLIGSFSVKTWGLWTVFGGRTVLLSTTRATHNKNHRTCLQQ